MSEHQPLPVAGYRPQSATAVMLVNHNKEVEERTLRVLDDLAEMARAGGIDGRWLAIGRTHLEQGWMAVNRAIFQPGRAALPEDTSNEEPRHG